MSTAEKINSLEQQYLAERNLTKKMDLKDQINELKGVELSCNFENKDCENCGS
jgi:hypothetical protein